MTQTYLNAAQKRALVTLMACVSFLEEIQNAVKLPKEVATNIKRGRTWAYKAATAWVDGIDAPTRRAVLNLAKDTEIGVVTRATRANTEAMERYVAGREYVEQMAELAMAHRCRECDGSIRDGCPLYESLKHYDIPPWDEEHPRCEYAGTGAV
ncbi:MAG: DUF5651 domain-containing protein [Alicyclobacillus sp.]|nr:DUF5651 domain-containing protein [Alicyclobacillus sp.]